MERLQKIGAIDINHRTTFLRNEINLMFTCEQNDKNLIQYGEEVAPP